MESIWLVIWLFTALCNIMFNLSIIRWNQYDATKVKILHLKK